MNFEDDCLSLIDVEFEKVFVSGLGDRAYHSRRKKYLVGFRSAVVRLHLRDFRQSADIERSRVRRAQRGIDPEVVAAGGGVLIHTNLDQNTGQGKDVLDGSSGKAPSPEIGR